MVFVVIIEVSAIALQDLSTSFIKKIAFTLDEYVDDAVPIFIWIFYHVIYKRDFYGVFYIQAEGYNQIAKVHVYC